MKIYTRIAAIAILFTTVLSSCSKDDDPKQIIPGPPVGVEIEYKVSASANIISLINYRMGNGTTFSSLANEDNPTQWDKIMVALYAEMPTTAFLEVKCTNPTNEQQTCTLSFYNGTELIATQTAPVPAMNTTPVTIQLSEIIDEPQP